MIQELGERHDTPGVYDHMGITPGVYDHTGFTSGVYDHTGITPGVCDHTDITHGVYNHTSITPGVYDHTCIILIISVDRSMKTIKNSTAGKIDHEILIKSATGKIIFGLLRNISNQVCMSLH